jgi:predicted homoserine dehydrogenase-like protein
MVEIDKRLARRAAEGRPVRVAVLGAGQMGTEIVTQIGEMQGMEVSVVVDIDRARAEGGYACMRSRPRVVFATTAREAEGALGAGSRVAAVDYRIATSLPQVDVIIDATGSAESGALATVDAVAHKKHVVMMNVECDVTIGPILRRMAEQAGVVYSLAAGDEPAAILELIRYARAVGFPVVAAGKGKNNPLDIYATPASLADKARARAMSARMLCEFVDGSKTSVEMAAVSNATGLVPDVRGMHGAKSRVGDLTRVFVPRADGGVLSRKGIVDFAIGVHPGVFVIIEADIPRIREGLVQRDMGDGPYYLLFRPFHLCSLEVPITAAVAALYGESSGHPGPALVSECLAVAKRDIRAGETLDGIGETCYRGSIDTADVAHRERLLPLGIARGCVARHAIGKDSVIGYDDVEVAGDSALIDLRRLQDKVCAAGPANDPGGAHAASR